MTKEVLLTCNLTVKFQSAVAATWQIAAMTALERTGRIGVTATAAGAEEGVLIKVAGERVR